MSRFLAVFVLAAASLFAQSDTVSVEELRSPLEGKALRALRSARSHLDSGQRERGMQELRQAMSYPGAIPYAVSMLGLEHLRNGQVDVAIGELQEAVRLLPWPENHSNLAYALYVTGRAALLETSLMEARRALQLNPASAKTRYVLGLILLRHGSLDQALFHLREAAREIPSAHLVIAKHYELAGRASEAEKERSAYWITANSLLAASR